MLRQKYYLIIFVLLIQHTYLGAASSMLLRNTAHERAATHINTNDHIRLGGLILFETIVSNFDQGGSRFDNKKIFSTFCHPRTNIFIETRANPWLKGFFSLAFSGTCGYGAQNDEGRFRKNPRPIDEAVLHFGHKTQPWYMNAGVTYLPYGQYQRHMVPATFTQLLSQSQALTAEIGYSNESISAAGYIFRGSNTKNNLSNGGLRLRYQVNTQNIGAWQIIADWIYDMPTAVNYIAYQRSGAGTEKGFDHHASGATLTLKNILGAWSYVIQYSSALKNFDVTSTTFDRPSALSITTDYQHTIQGIDAKLGLSGHQSFRARLVGPGGLPKYRLHAYWILTPWKNLWTGLHMVWDKDYSTSSGGTNQKSITGLVTASVFFA